MYPSTPQPVPGPDDVSEALASLAERLLRLAGAAGEPARAVTIGS